MASIEEEVLALDQQWVEAVNAGDAAGAASLYADDAVVLAPNSEPVRGRSQIEGFFEEFFKLQPSFLPLNTFRIEDSGDMAANAGTYTLKLAPPGADVINDHGKYLGVFKRQPDGSLKLILDTWNTSEPLG